MARADTATLLALDRYAEIMSVAPPHFNQGAGTEIFPVSSQCHDVWFQHAWQATDRIGREELARAIGEAEAEIAEYLGYWPAPVWIEHEIRDFPRPYRRDRFGSGLNIRGGWAGFPLKWGKLIQAGRRAVSLLGTPTITFSDLDGDGFLETATVVQATTVTDVNQIKVYFQGYNGAPEWEIRPARSKVISLGLFSAQFWTWQVIHPSLWDAFPTTAGPRALDLTDATIYESEVDIYREFTDFSLPSAKFFWEPKPNAPLAAFCGTCGGSGCPACSLTEQDGCLYVRDVHAGLAVAQPANFDEDSGEWSEVTWRECRAPDLVKVFYLAGDIDDLYLSGRRIDPLSRYYAEAIAWLATARLSRPFCSCGTVEKWVSELQWDTARTGPDEPSFVLDVEDTRNPFGTRIGEIRAWRRLKLQTRRLEVAVI